VRVRPPALNQESLATLSFCTNWTGFNGYQFDVWWVDLNIKTGPTTGYTYRIRDQKLRCRPLGS
jgi:hypothetical protein